MNEQHTEDQRATVLLGVVAGVSQTIIRPDMERDNTAYAGAWRLLTAFVNCNLVRGADEIKGLPGTDLAEIAGIGPNHPHRDAIMSGILHGWTFQDGYAFHTQASEQLRRLIHTRQSGLARKKKELGERARMVDALEEIGVTFEGRPTTRTVRETYAAHFSGGNQQ